jgi:hypothetical protein
VRLYSWIGGPWYVPEPPARYSAIRQKGLGCCQRQELRPTAGGDEALVHGSKHGHVAGAISYEKCGCVGIPVTRAPK